MTEAHLTTSVVIGGELFELDQLLGTQDSETVVGSRVNRIVTWMGLDIVQMPTTLVEREPERVRTTSPS